MRTKGTPRSRLCFTAGCLNSQILRFRQRSAIAGPHALIQGAGYEGTLEELLRPGDPRISGIKDIVEIKNGPDADDHISISPMALSSSVARHLAQEPLFQQHPETLPFEDRIKLSYERAMAVCRAYKLSTSDVLSLSPKFWQLHADPIWAMDGAAYTVATIQINLCAGTLARFAKGREDVAEIARRVLAFETFGQFCLTEVGHGLDVINMETTATLLETGEFDLHSPSSSAAKYMAPTTPVALQCLCVVFARLVVEGEDYGVKPFLVPVHDGNRMFPGITAVLLPPRGGSRPLNHALTTFNHVVLPPTALLGPFERPRSPRDAFFDQIQRVTVGTIATALLGVPLLKVGSVIAARYSLRRTVVNHHTGILEPIINFQTQKAPVLVAIAQARVLEAFQSWATKTFMTAEDPRVRQAIATISKIILVSLTQQSLLALSDRCGAQGLFEVNQLSSMHGDSRGTAIAEGDVIAISIRLASELLLRRYTVPSTDDPTALLARCEAAMFEDLQQVMQTIPNHRCEAYNQLVLPESFALVRTIGLRMAYDAAVEAGVDPDLIALFEVVGVQLTSAQFVELGVTLQMQRKMEADAVAAVFPRLQGYIDEMDVDQYVSAPIVSNERWSAYVGSLRSWTS